jgi:type I restriction enzyme M protein
MEGMAGGKQKSTKANGGATLGFEDKLWAAADKLRGNMDAAEYKHVVLGLIFLKYISDAFLEKYNALKSDKHTDPEDKDEYLADNIFWVPPEARWDYLQKNAKRPEIGTLVDDALTSIERDNKTLKGVLPKDYARPALDKARLGELIDLIATIGLGDKESRQRDILGRVYEYFLGRFADAEGKNGGQFYTPACVVRVLVEMIEPYKGRVFDPCCGSGGMFVQAVKFVQAHASGNGNGNGKSKVRAQREISIYGQESNNTTWRLALMNLAIRSIDGDIQWGDSFLDDKHKDLKADFLLANPPFNMEDWRYSKVKDDVRWKRFDQPTGNAQFLLPPGGARKQKDGSVVHVDGGNANYAWILHFLHHLAPHGTAGFVLANGSLTSNTSGEGDIRKAIIEADLVDCIISLPGQLFCTTQIAV